MTTADALGQAWKLHQAGQLAQAEQLYRQVLQVSPNRPQAWYLLGAACHAQGKLQDALASYQQSLRLKPDFGVVHNNLGVALAALGRTTEAMAHYHEALRHDPDSAEAYSNLGGALGDQQKWSEAEANYRHALRLKPDYADAHNNLAVALAAQDRLDEAAASYQQALRLRPDYPESRAGLAGVLGRQGKLDEAVAGYQEAVRLRPDSPENRLGLAVALSTRGDINPALDEFDHVLRLRPDHADAHHFRAILWLAQGRFEEGWPEYEWRWRCKETPPRQLPGPAWDGGPLAGRTLLLHAEQGFGDILMFIRYAALARERGAGVVFECPKPLLPLLARGPGIDRLVPWASPLPAFDVHAPLLSLPRLFGTTLATVPAKVAYLSADPDLVERWRRELAGQDGFKIGIAWQGNPKYPHDRYRSFPLRELAPLARLPGVRLYSLQKGQGTEQLRLADSFPVADLGGRLDDATGAFMDTAAVVRNLDLVISPNTAVAHLAGALGAPVWVPLPLTPDWRWMLDREDSPWYPTARLFRQSRLGEWDDVFARITEAVRLKLGEQSGKATPIVVEVAPGELIDKITILQIKSDRISDPAKLANVRRELQGLTEARDRAVRPRPGLEPLAAELRAVNEALWEVEDALRLCERNDDFGPRFVELARSVYKHNDRRAALKCRINELLGSQLIEEKAYTATR